MNNSLVFVPLERKSAWGPALLPTFNQAVVGFSPGVAVLRSQNADRLLVGLQRGVPDLLQLHVQLVYRQWASVAVVHIQDKELQGDAALLKWSESELNLYGGGRGRAPESCEPR